MRVFPKKGKRATVSAADDADLPPIVVLIVEERTRAADRLAQLLRLWGAATAQPLAQLNDVAGYLARHPEPALLLLDHSLHSHVCVDIALWLVARPSVRRRIRVVAYTNADEGEILARLHERIGTLAHDPALAEQLLGRTGTHERVAIECAVDEAQASTRALDVLYRRLYDAHLSKRVSIDDLRVALRTVAQGIVTGA